MAEEKKTVEIKPKSGMQLQYQGDVTVKVLKKGKVQKTITNHNDGTDNLFKFLLDCLAGNFIESSRPKWVIPFYIDGTTEKYSLPIAIPIQSVEVFQDSSTQLHAISYRCLFSSTQLYNSTQIDGLLFYSTSGKNSVSFNRGEKIDTQNYSMKMYFGTEDNEFQDADILVEWQLRIISIADYDEDED